MLTVQTASDCKSVGFQKFTNVIGTDSEYIIDGNFS